MVDHQNNVSEDEILRILKEKAIQESTEEVKRRLKASFYWLTIAITVVGFLTLDLFIKNIVDSYANQHNTEFARKVGEVSSYVVNTQAKYKDIADLEFKNKLTYDKLAETEQNIALQQIVITKLVDNFENERNKYQDKIALLEGKVKSLEVKVDLLNKTAVDSNTVTDFNENSDYQVLVRVYGNVEVRQADIIYKNLIEVGFQTQPPKYDDEGINKTSQVDIYYNAKGKEKLANIESLLNSVEGIKAIIHPQVLMTSTDIAQIKFKYAK